MKNRSIVTAILAAMMMIAPSKMSAQEDNGFKKFRTLIFEIELYYHFDFVSNRIILDRESYDFGRPKWHLLDVLKVPSTYRGMRIVYRYDDGFHDDFNVSEELLIEYYD
ncbi:MAG: hypothetical protein IJ081_02590 [Prevotella sp.]|nr:hypothetical protein [Prevotella sp.]